MSDYTYRWLEPNEYPLLDFYFAEEKVPRVDPNFSRVLAAFSPAGDLVGFLCLQLVAHAEPIFVKPEHRRSGVASFLTQAMDSYADTLGLAGLYTQPTNEAAEKLVELVGFTKLPHPIWLKTYLNNYDRALVDQEEEA